MTPIQYLLAARVPTTLPSQCFGMWTIRRLPIPHHQRVFFGALWPSYTLLHHINMASLHLEHGEIVMEDSAPELRKHLPIWLHARGRVLVTGLGLGCVVRGLLHNPAVEHIDVVEIDRDIVEIVGAEFDTHPRVTLHHGDALSFDPPAGRRWDFAWHDLWNEDQVEGEHLQVTHGKLLLRCRGFCDVQGAWAFPRWTARIWPHQLLGAPKRTAA